MRAIIIIIVSLIALGLVYLYISAEMYQWSGWTCYETKPGPHTGEIIPCSQMYQGSDGLMIVGSTLFFIIVSLVLSFILSFVLLRDKEL